MMKRLKFFAAAYILILVSTVAYAQNFTNSWINYSQNYYKFPITQNGIYRINYNSLQNAGFPVNSVNPKNIQLFGRGKEVPLYVYGEDDEVFDNTDYIEFYAQSNDGWFDSLVYDQPQHIGNPYYSLFNDTAYYFLTWNTSLANQRYTLENDTVNFNLYTPEPYCLFTSRKVYSNEYFPGETNSIATTDPEYTATEGWFSSRWQRPNTRTENIPINNVFTSGPPAIINTKVIGASNASNANNDNHIKIELVGNSTVQLDDFFFDGYTAHKLNYTTPVSDLLAPTTQIKFSLISTSTSHAQYTAVAYTSIEYAHTFNFDNTTSFFFKIPANSNQTHSKLIISNFNLHGQPLLFDLTNNKRITVANSNGVLSALVPDASSERQCMLIGSNDVINITQIVPVSSTSKFTDYGTLGNTSNYVIISNRALWTEATNYALYRNSTGFNSLLVDVDELYDQFAYGIKKHPLSIRKFVDYAVQNFSVPIENVFLIGKGISWEQARRSPSVYKQCLVPTFGYPPSDVLLTAKINGTVGYEPGVPIGRIAAKDNADVIAYRNKVMQLESQPEALWMKNILHFAGGFDLPSQGVLKYYLKQYENVVEDTLYGGNVTTFSKTSTVPIQITASDSIKNLIETGVSMMTFFGHAAGSGFDQNIDDPSTYNWNGKYPLLIANSCFVGNIHLPPGQYITASENYTLTPNVGTIAFLANIGSNVPLPLYEYTKSFLVNLTQKHYGKGIGFAMKEAINSVQVNTYDLLKYACLEMTLHGDPAININTHEYPDYAISTPNVYTSPATVTTDIDSFMVNIIVSNIGRAINDSIILEVKRVLPNGNSGGIYSKLIKAPYYKDTISFKLSTEPLQGAGINSLEIYVDATNKIFELTEANNRINYSLYIRSDEINPVYPYYYAVHPKNKVTLKASTNDPFAAVKTYRFQIDTTDLFTHPIQGTVTQGGGVVKWQVPFTLTDSTVYFWRVSPDSTAGTNYKWRESSFQYIKDKTGWGQAHFFQFKNDEYHYVKYNRPQRKFDFVPHARQLTCRTFSAPPGQRPTDDDLYATEYKLDSEVQEYAGCQYTANLHVAVIDSLTLQSWGKYWVDNSQNPPVVYNPTHNFGNFNNGSGCRNQLEKYFIFQTGNLSQMNGLTNMLNNGIPDGNYVLIYTWIRGNSQAIINTGVIAAMENMGADSIRYLSNDRAYIFFAKKGYPNTAQEVISPPNSFSQINFSTTLTSNWNTGTISSEYIGPAYRWDSLHWRQLPSELPTRDSVKLNLIGIKYNGTKDTLIHNLSYGNNDISLNGIANAQVYPYLQMAMDMSDDSIQTAAQLRRWHILYQEIPEAAVNPNMFYNFYNPTVDEGEKVNFKVAVENVSNVSMDSLLIKYWFEDRNRMIHPLTYARQDSLRANDTLLSAITVPTLGFSGSNTLWMEVNPKKDNSNSYDQLEQYHFNNYASVKYLVGGDRINPIMDVTFDGVHIIDGDLVSAKPHIEIRLNDENKYLALNDTSVFAVYLKTPESNDLNRVWFSGANPYQIKFVPAQLPNNTASITLDPQFAIDGKYELMVESKDASNNKSGENTYRISFEIINKSTITAVMNYPNPFSTSTRFVFTLTGSVIPDYFKIRIMNINGKVVREITQDELGTIRIGRNITEYAWDGRDEFGDRLANGVYFYKVFTGIQGENIEKNETQADQYFKKGYGKMVLIGN
ncbi:MAG: T9SS type A sorting domain-containing protein [Bacteroidia bacterium]|nr:T9SS type A sorting domain-containing protein [Bacteroidia bacterium]MCZ2248520.1 C25 family cysteine peptidase [Bacteroidia bacterium]